MKSTFPEWLGLKDAAERLGIHPTTLRRWADSGEIPALLTPGGHRRFSVSDLERFADERRRLRMVSGIEHLLAEHALSHTRVEIETHHDQPWLQAYGGQEREHNRLLGRRLIGVVLQYVSLNTGGDSLLEEARSIGKEYAQHAIQLGLPLTSALAAALFFRDSIVEVAIQLPEHAHLRPEANTHLLRRINTVLNTVQLSTADAYSKQQ